MATSSNRDHFFQTTSALDEADRKSQKASNTNGNPIRLPSKILAVATNPFAKDGTVFLAESAGTVKQVSLTNGNIKNTRRGPTTPLTSLCFLPNGSCFAGCWDKSIWRFPGKTSDTDSQSSPAQYKGHMDFVKCLLYVSLADKTPLVISGGADGDILFWSTTSSSRHLHRLSPQSRGIECLVLDPLSSPDAPVVFFSTSQREIYTFTLPSSIAEIKSTTISPAITAHETSVYKLHFDSDGDLWTASADKTAQHLVREDSWESDTTLHHPDFVRDVVTHDRYGWVITACRDEEVRVWNEATGDLYHVFSGHFEEVTGLCLVGDVVVSVSIDATVRRWDVSPSSLKTVVEEAAKHPKEIDAVEEVQKQGNVNEFGLTEEEEAELKAMMEGEETETLDRMADGTQ